MNWTHALLIPAVFAALVGCGSSDPEVTTDDAKDLTVASGELEALGVYYFKAEGKNENATVTLYDENKEMIGGGQLSKAFDKPHAEIQWKGVRWESEPDADAVHVVVRRDGAVVAGEDLKEYDAAEQVLELAVDEAKLPSAVAQAQACKKKGKSCGLFINGSCCKKCKGRALGIGQGTCS